MIQLVDKLPENPKDGDKVFLSLGKPGFWFEMTFVNDKWQETAGYACPYIPDFFKEQYK